jgi:hypothetical protein
VDAKERAGDRGLLGLSKGLHTAQKHCKQNERDTKPPPRVKTFFMVFSCGFWDHALAPVPPRSDFAHRAFACAAIVSENSRYGTAKISTGY